MVYHIIPPKKYRLVCFFLIKNDWRQVVVVFFFVFSKMMDFRFVNWLFFQLASMNFQETDGPGDNFLSSNTPSYWGSRDQPPVNFLPSKAWGKGSRNTTRSEQWPVHPGYLLQKRGWKSYPVIWGSVRSHYKNPCEPIRISVECQRRICFTLETKFSTLKNLGGGFKYFFFSPLFGGRFPFWRIFFRCETTN